MGKSKIIKLCTGLLFVFLPLLSMAGDDMPLDVRKFVLDWETESRKLAAESPDSPYNAFFIQYLQEHPDSNNGRYYLLPKRVLVRTFGCKINPEYVRARIRKEGDDFRKEYLSRCLRPEKIEYFVPKLDSSYNVLYAFDERIKELSSYLDQEKDRAGRLETQLRELWEYIPGIVKYWEVPFGRRMIIWSIDEFLLIHEIMIGTDGYEIEWPLEERISFIPKD